MKKSVVAGVAIASVALLGLSRKDSKSSPRKPKDKLRARFRGALDPEWPRAEAQRSAERFILYGLIPLWSLVGALDWLWHRQTKIETTSGVQESFTHLLMMTEAGMPVFAGLFLQANAGLFALLTAGTVLHQLTAMWDVNYTVSRRAIPAREQHTHSFMETIPFDILVVMGATHPEQFKSLFGVGEEKPEFSLRFKEPPLSVGKILAVMGATGAFVGLPHVEELWRCWRARQKGLTGVNTPECVAELYGDA